MFVSDAHHKSIMESRNLITLLITFLPTVIDSPIQIKKLEPLQDCKRSLENSYYITSGHTKTAS